MNEYDFELWKCVTVNTHSTKKVISDEMYDSILELVEIIDGVRLGSYGMELALICDTADEDLLKEKIEGIISR
ncbi:MAG: hypothetical protein OEV73_00190 [Desulfobulbaceae bacterium]|nr:hypothetical protein [Desulfobulbaceae bacterium]